LKAPKESFSFESPIFSTGGCNKRNKFRQNAVKSIGYSGRIINTLAPLPHAWKIASKQNEQKRIVANPNLPIQGLAGYANINP